MSDALPAAAPSTASATVETANGTRRRARRGIAIFFAALFVFSGIAEGLIIADGRALSELGNHVLFLMWTPALASLVARVLLREGIRDVSFRITRRAWFPAAVVWMYPIAVGLVAYGLAWTTGLASFAPPPMLVEQGVTSPFAHFALRLGLFATLVVPLSAVTAAGEEIGWRGYLLTRLVDAGVARPVLVSGVIWGLWHVPLIVSGQYAVGPSPLLSSAVFMVTIMVGTHYFAWSRLSSGSVWPAIVAHAAWNSIIQGAFDMSTANHSASRTTSIWVGESGLLLGGVSLLSIAPLFFIRWEMRRNPRDAGEPIQA